MSRKTINQVIIAILQEEKKPLSIPEIYALIKSNSLYTFKSTNPESIIRNQLRRHCENIHFPKASEKKYFVRNSDNSFSLKKN